MSDTVPHPDCPVCTGEEADSEPERCQFFKYTETVRCIHNEGHDGAHGTYAPSQKYSLAHPTGADRPDPTATRAQDALERIMTDVDNFNPGTKTDHKWRAGYYQSKVERSGDIAREAHIATVTMDADDG